MSASRSPAFGPWGIADELVDDDVWAGVEELWALEDVGEAVLDDPDDPPPQPAGRGCASRAHCVDLKFLF